MRDSDVYTYILTRPISSPTMGSYESSSNTPSVHPTEHDGSSNHHISHLPSHAVDTHVHVFDPKLGPYAPGRAYTPPDAPLEKLIAFNQSLSTDTNNTTLVLVQPSPYKNDCSVMLHCLRELKNRHISVFGIAVLDLDNTSDAQLKEMHTLGVRGIRLNFQADGNQVQTAQLVTALYRTADRIRYLPGWVIQLFVPGWTWDGEIVTVL